MKKLAVMMALLTTAGPFFCYAMPDWAKGSIQENSTDIITICNGEGPSLAIAREEAIASCTKSVVRFKTGSVNYKSYSLQTESDAAYHEAVTSNLKISGAICNPQNEEVEQEPGLFRVWLKCSFKKSEFKSEVVSTKDPTSSEKLRVRPKKANGTDFPGRHIKDASKCLVSLAVIPECESVLIKAASPRIQRCNGNPIRMTVEAQSTLVIRSPGYKPQELQSDCKGGDSVVEIILDPM